MSDLTNRGRISTADELLELLERRGISTSTTRHAPVRTVEEAERHWRGIEGQACKNLLFRDARKRYWMLVVEADRGIDLKELPKRIGSARLSFASAGRLREVLGIEPGAVSPLALVNDEDHQITVVVHEPLLAADTLLLHPLENSATTAISGGDLRRFLEETGHVVKTIDLDATDGR